MHPSAYTDAAKFVKKFLDRQSDLKIVDIGSQDINGNLRQLFSDRGWRYVGADLEAGRNVDVVLKQPYSWPEFKDSQFDVVVSSQVLEHVEKPWRWMPEIARIVRPGGWVYICTPHTIGYHATPKDCWRCWPDGLTALFEDAGLKPLHVYKGGITNGIGDTTGIATK